MNMNVYKVYEGMQPERMIQVPRNLLDPYSGQGDNDDETAQRGFSMQALREFLHTLGMQGTIQSFFYLFKKKSHKLN